MDFDVIIYCVLYMYTGVQINNTFDAFCYCMCRYIYYKSSFDFIKWKRDIFFFFWQKFMETYTMSFGISPNWNYCLKKKKIVCRAYRRLYTKSVSSTFWRYNTLYLISLRSIHKRAYYLFDKIV